MSGHEALSELTPEQQRELLRKLLKKRASEDARCPMSVQQQSLWFEYLRSPEWTGYNVFLPSRIRSKIDVAALHKTIDHLVKRHACLRTTFGTESGETYQEVHEVLAPEFEIADATGMSDREIRERCEEEAARPFSLESGPLLRLKLFQRGENDTVVIATTHHIVVDFWSLVLLLDEIRSIYDDLSNSRKISITKAPSNYAAFVKHQRRLLDEATGEELHRYWRKQLRDASLVTEFPTDFVRPATFTGRAAVEPIEFRPETVTKMSTLAQERGATFPAVVLALVQTFVHRYTSQASFLIGSPFSGRLHQDYESTVGFFVNMLPLRADVSDEVTFLDLVDQASGTFVDSLQHEALPLAEIVRDASVARDASRSPLFQVCCTFEKSHLRQEEGRAGFLFAGDTQRTNLGGMEQESFAVPVQTCHYDLEFMFERSDDGLRTMLCYCRDLFDRASVLAMTQNLRDLADQLVMHPTRALGDLPWSSNPRSIEERTVGQVEIESPWAVAAIRRIADDDPDRVALRIGDEEKTYRELVGEADRIAAAIAGRGIGIGSYIPVVGNRGPSLVAAMIGIIASGATVVPIDASEPAVTPHDLMEDTQASLVILCGEDATNSPYRQELDAATAASRDVETCTIDALLAEPIQSGVNLPEIAPDDLCYLIYTSGSSGRPKGVMTEHRALDNTLQWRADTVQLKSDDRILILLSHQFDAGFGLIFSSLVQGAQLVWSRQPASNVEAIIDLIVGHELTVLPTIPSLLALIIDHPWFERCVSLRQVWTGGEAMPSDLPQRLRDHRRLPFWNFYGPTEAAIEATAADVRDHQSNRVIPIGTPVHNTEVLVLDSQRRRCPPTVPGELAIAGPGLARGYLGRSALTAERFPSLADGRRVFLTGDRGRERPDGSLEFLGRTDDQVKVGGYRIELQEIEQALLAVPHVADAAVKVHQAGSGHACLIGYVAANSASSIGSDQLQDQLKKHLAASLPPFKRPRRIIALPSLPKTSSGKVDRKRLPQVTDQQLNELPYDPPRTPLESYLVSAFGDEIDVGEVGIKQDFFELGGTSLQAAVMASKLSDQLQLHVPTSLLFDMPDVLRIAERLAILHRDAICARFGLDSVDIYVPTSATANASDNQSPSHPLIAELRGTSGGSLDSVEKQKSEPEGQSKATPVFMIHPPGGIVACYRELGKLTNSDQDFYAIRSRGLHGDEVLPNSVEEMASDYVDAIRATVPHGPYQIGGWSLGGIVAWEVARQLESAGEEVERIILLDTAIPDGAVDGSEREAEPSPGLEYGLDFTLDELSELQPDEQLPLLWQHAKNLGVLDDETPQEIVDQALNDLKHLFHHHLQVIGSHSLSKLSIPVLLIRPRDVPQDVGMSNDRGWDELAPRVDVAFVSGHHHSMVKLPGAEEIANLIFSH